MKKEKIKLYLKGLLLWITILFVILFIAGIDSIADQGYLVLFFMTIDIALCYTCCKVISKDELERLLSNKWLDKIFNNDHK